MTKKDLVKALAPYPDDAVVYVEGTYTGQVVDVARVTPSVDAPKMEVYIEIDAAVRS
jgi:hypothetical protein